MVKDSCSTEDLTLMLRLTALGFYFIAIIWSFDLKTLFYESVPFALVSSKMNQVSLYPNHFLKS